MVVIDDLVIVSLRVQGNITNPPPLSSGWVVDLHDWDVTNTVDLIFEDTGFLKVTPFKRRTIQPHIMARVVAEHALTVDGVKIVLDHDQFKGIKGMGYRGHQRPLVPLNAVAFHFLQLDSSNRVSPTQNVNVAVQIRHVHALPAQQAVCQLMPTILGRLIDPEVFPGLGGEIDVMVW